MPANRSTAQLQINAELHTRLATEADARGLNIRFLAEALLKEGIEQLIPAEEFTLFKRAGIAIPACDCGFPDNLPDQHGATCARYGQWAGRK